MSSAQLNTYLYYFVLAGEQQPSFESLNDVLHLSQEASRASAATPTKFLSRPGSITPTQALANAGRKSPYK